MLSLLIGMVIGGVSFAFLGEGLIRNGVTWFDGLQKKTRDMKNKKVWEYGIFLGVGMILIFGATFIGLGDLPQGFLLGTLYSLNSIIFESSFFDKLRNTLR